MPQSSTWLGLACLALLAPWGVSLLITGLGRGRNAAHNLLSCWLAFILSALAFWAVGCKWAGLPWAASHGITLHGKFWNLIGAAPLLSAGMNQPGMLGASAGWWVLAGMIGAGWTAMLAVGAAAERWRLASLTVVSLLIGGLIFPLGFHWLWAGGWLAGLGLLNGWGHGTLDAGGALVVQTTGAVCALALTWRLGPRRNKYNRQQQPLALPGHNTVLILGGAAMAGVGWLGWNAMTALAIWHLPATLLPRLAMNTWLGGGAALLIALGLSARGFGRPDASMAANAWMAGLAAVSAGSPWLHSGAAFVIGLAAGALAFYAIQALELHARTDDPSGVIAAQGLGGIWGALALGVAARLSPGWFPGGLINGMQLPLHGGRGQLAAQWLGIASWLGALLPLAIGCVWLLSQWIPPRVSPEAEAQGLDLHELGGSAYPETAGFGED